MARKIPTKFLSYVVVSALLCTALYRCFLSPSATAVVSFPTATAVSSFSVANFVIRENLTNDDLPIPPRGPPPLLSTTAVLLPEWEVLVIVFPETPPSTLDGYFCRFETGETTPARFSGVLPFPDRATFTCPMPAKYRRNRRWLKQPILLKSPERESPTTPMPPLLRWSYLVYDSLTTDDDVVLFAKGLNNRQGINRLPAEFRCIFSAGAGTRIRTVVTSSAQEVFRCKLPEPFPLPANGVLVSLEIVAGGQVVPSVAYYTRQRRLASRSEKSLLCATTVVYNVTKFLNEWILYHSKIGVEKFLLYDNGSEDDLHRSVNGLVAQDYDVIIHPWWWPKTQESGFSHSAVYARDACTWMMYLDVNEFVYSPSWQNLSRPSKSLLHSSLNPTNKSGQILIGCHEFGPSDQISHPSDGITQGYSCQRKNENRHKSIVLLASVDDSLLNVNHYKYQAWPEFKAKFRRRVSAYVLDWTQKLNPNSKDRTPGLGFEPVEPQGWPRKFCEVWDYSLKDLVRRWFGSEPNSGRVKLPLKIDDGDQTVRRLS